MGKGGEEFVGQIKNRRRLRNFPGKKKWSEDRDLSLNKMGVCEKGGDRPTGETGVERGLWLKLRGRGGGTNKERVGLSQTSSMRNTNPEERSLARERRARYVGR